jgi:Domain of unknown function (DUF4386)
MNWTKNPGRVAGLLYLLLMVGPLRLVYIPKTLFVPDDAPATANNILAHEALFRLGMFSELFTAVVLIFLTLAFYRLFEGVSRYHSVLVIIVGGVMPACIAFVGVVQDAAALILVRGTHYLSVFDKPQRDALAMLFLRLHGQQTVASEILWGLWLLPLAVLVYRSGFLPRFLGVWLVINGLVYVAMSVTGLLAPQYGFGISGWAFPALLGELALMFWLIIKGVDQQAVAASRAGQAVSVEGS